LHQNSNEETAPKLLKPSNFHHQEAETSSLNCNATLKPNNLITPNEHRKKTQLQTYGTERLKTHTEKPRLFHETAHTFAKFQADEILAITDPRPHPSLRPKSLQTLSRQVNRPNSQITTTS
jgi:hypothetical protein